MKKIYSLILLAAALICLPGTVKAAAAYYEVDGIRYYGSNASTKNVQVTALSSGKYTGDIVIPGTFEYNSATYTVTGIKDDAFSGCTALTSVTIEEGPTSIGQYSFQNCSSLASITFPSTITTVAYYAISNCTVLKSITFLGSTPPSSFYAFGSSWPSITGCASDLVIYVPEEAVDAYKTKFATDIIQPIGGGSACKMPKLNTPTLSFESITITWSAGADETQYQYALGTKGFEPTAWTDVEGTERTLTLNDLYTSNSYDLYIRSYCGAGEGEQSNGAKVNFSPVCPAPTNLEASAVTDATATVSWTAADGISKYQYIYVTSGEPDWSAATVTTETSLDLSSLSASTGYDFYVRSWYSDKSQSAFQLFPF